MSNTKTRNVVLWIIQGLLAAVFLMAGLGKLLAPPQQLQVPPGLSIGFLKFIGAVEVLGALGLVLPGLFRIARWLSPLAAAGLTTVMLGAVLVTVSNGAAAPALVPLVVGSLTVAVAIGRGSGHVALS